MFDSRNPIFGRLTEPVAQIIRLVVERTNRDLHASHESSFTLNRPLVNDCLGLTLLITRSRISFAGDRFTRIHGFGDAIDWPVRLDAAKRKSRQLLQTITNNVQRISKTRHFQTPHQGAWQAEGVMSCAL